MPNDNDSPAGSESFLRVAAATGLDTSDPERMADLHRRVTLMREGLARIYEIDVAGSESPSVFVPNRD